MEGGAPILPQLSFGAPTGYELVYNPRTGQYDLKPIAGGGGGAGGGLPIGFGGGGGGAGGAGGLSPWQWSLISGGLDLIGGYLGQRAQSKSEAANRELVRERIQQALAQLSPEQIQALTRFFLPQQMQMAAPQMQTATQAFRQQAARAGTLGTPYAQTAELGFRGQMINRNVTQAFQNAMGLAGQRAGAITGTPLPFGQPNTALANSLGTAIDRGFLINALGGGNRQQQGTVPDWYWWTTSPPTGGTGTL